MTISDRELIELAKKAMQNAYAPYSKFKVGAAVLTKNGKVYTGCNVENSSYGLTMCAERVAVFKAVSEGEREFYKIAIVSSAGKKTFPCGACRQVLYEFSDNMEIILEEDGEIYKTSLKDLFPEGFRLKEEDSQ